MKCSTILKKKKKTLTQEVKIHQEVMPVPRLASCLWAYPSLFSFLLLSFTGYPQSIAGFALEPAINSAPISNTLVTCREGQRMDLSFYALTGTGTHPYRRNPCFFVLLYLCVALDGWRGNNLLCLIQKKKMTTLIHDNLFLLSEQKQTHRLREWTYGCLYTLLYLK